MATSFNQDWTTFANTTDSGFELWNIDPVSKERVVSIPGGVSICSMLFNTPLFAVVGTGQGEYNENTVVIWHVHMDKAFKTLPFNSQVYAVQLTNDRIVVALKQMSWICDYKCEYLHQIPTSENTGGALAVSIDNRQQLMATPSHKFGSIDLHHLSSGAHLGQMNAHRSGIGALAFSHCGGLLASASQRGTVVRIWDTNKLQAVQELRRGANPCTVYSLTFSHSAEHLACLGSRGTVHMFGLKTSADGEADVKNTSMNRKSYAASFSWVSSYFSSEWSSSWFHMPSEFAQSKAAVAFLKPPSKDILLIASKDAILRVKFDVANGGPMVLEQQYLPSEFQVPATSSVVVAESPPTSTVAVDMQPVDSVVEEPAAVPGTTTDQPPSPQDDEWEEVDPSEAKASPNSTKLD